MLEMVQPAGLGRRLRDSSDLWSKSSPHSKYHVLKPKHSIRIFESVNKGPLDEIRDDTSILLRENAFSVGGADGSLTPYDNMSDPRTESLRPLIEEDFVVCRSHKRN